MRVVVLDFETYYDQDYTLKKLSTEAYIRDPRFEAHGAAIKWSASTSAQWYDRRQLEYILKEEDWSDVFLICHHAQFDGFILNHHYNVRPRTWGCTLSMGRLLLGNHLSVGLDAMRKHFGIAPKITPYSLFIGKHWHEMSPDVQRQVAAGACDEVESIWKIFGLLRPDFPAEEYEVVDEVVRMFTEPVLRADVDLLGKVWEREETLKVSRRQALGVTDSDLQSSEKFAELLRAEGEEPQKKQGKVSEKTGNSKMNYAFAKTDDYMRGLLEHDNERIRTLAEARLGEKSTLMQTRAATLGWMASRGPLCVYLRYAGAGTLRVSGGDGANWLNFKRGSDIRRSILAPEGYLLAPVDSSQIECRVLHWLAGGPDEPVVQKFRANEDPYVDLASRFYGETIYKPAKDDPRRDEMEAKRGMGKQGRLMCLGPDTLVLTDNGLKPITAVQPMDRLWDGVEWVEHQGLVEQGEKEIISPLPGIELTPDHLVLCGQNWCPASLLQNASIRSHALASGSANLPLQVTNWERVAGFARFLFLVHAAPLSIWQIRIISMLADQRDAMRVLKNARVIGSKNTTDIPIYARTTRTGAACSDVYQQYSRAAEPNPNTMRMLITAGVGFVFTTPGAKIKENFLRIWSRCQAGMTQLYRLIESKTIKAISQGICVLQIQKLKRQIGATFAISTKKSQTYDLACAGPRNRFTIVSDAGPLIVHNCGYGASGNQFKITAKNGLYGPPVEISIEDANNFVAMYRDTNPSICAKHTGYWAQANRMISRLAGGPPVDWGPLHVKNHRIYLPNGCPLIYDTLEYHRPDPDENVRDFERGGFWRVRVRNGWKKMWGSKLTQNICEAVSRCIISQAMIRLKRKGYRSLNWPYDELLILLPKDGHEEQHVQECHYEMTRDVPWLPGLPLSCESIVGERYGK